MDNNNILQFFDRIPNFQGGAWRERKEDKANDLLISLVRGKNRCKFFNQPLIGSIEKDRVLSQSENDLWWWNLREDDPVEYVTQGTQTDYRESETQTDPWDPPYIVSDPAQTPEVLMIASLKYGEGLPVTSKELEDIIYERERSQIESAVPPISNNEEEMKERLKKVAELISKDVSHHNAEIEDVRQSKTLEMNNLLRAEMKQQEEQKNRILKCIFSNKLAEFKEKSQKIDKKLSRDLKKIEKKRSIWTNTVQMTDFPCEDVEPLTSYDSVLVSKRSSVPDSSNLNSLKELVDLENWLLLQQKFDMEPEVYGPKKEPHPSSLRKMIEVTEQKMLNQKLIKPALSRKERTFGREKVQVPPMTPTVFRVPQDVLDRESSAILLQKQLRGRAMQKEVLEICEMYEEFIEEYWKTNAISEEEQRVLDKKLNDDCVAYLEILNKADQIATREEILSRFEGTTISEEMNILSKTVARHKVWKNVEQLVLKAKDERRRREAEEAGRRQKELLQQNACEVHFKRMQV